MSELEMPKRPRREADFAAFMRELARPLPCHAHGAGTCCLEPYPEFREVLEMAWRVALTPRYVGCDEPRT